MLYDGPMSGGLRAGLNNAWRPAAHSLSGRLLLLTLFYVLITEVLIFMPSIGRYHGKSARRAYRSRPNRILPFTEPGGEQLSPALRAQLLTRAGAAAVTLKRPDQRELFLVHETPSNIDLTVDLRRDNAFTEMYLALDCLIEGGPRIVYIIAPTRITGRRRWR